MEDILPFIAMAVIIGVSFSITIALNVSSHKKRVQRWSVVAGELGLELVDEGAMSSLEMSGFIDGVGVTVRTERRRGGSRTRTVTVVRARPNRPMPAGLQIHPEMWGDDLMKNLGAQDIPLASRRHDDALMVKGSDVRAVQGLLDRPEALPALDLLVDGEGALVFSKGLFVDERFGDGGENLVEAVRGVVRATRALDHAAAGPWEDAAPDDLG